MSLKWHFLTLCEIRAAWLGTFSIPGGTTGPGFKAEIDTPLFLMFFDQFYHFFTFSFCAFSCFLSFCIFWFWLILMKWHFYDVHLLIAIRPYCNNRMSGRLHRVVLNRREYDVCVVVLPSLVFVWMRFFLFFVFQDVGEIHRRGDSLIYSRSPLCYFSWILSGLLLITCRGDSQERSN